QQLQDEVKFEKFRVEDMKNQMTLMKQYAEKQDAQQGALQKKVEQTSALEKTLSTCQNEMIQFAKERDEYKKGLEKNMIQVDRDLEERKKRVNDTFNSSVEDFTRLVNRVFSSSGSASRNQEEEEEEEQALKRQMAETIDALR